MANPGVQAGFQLRPSNSVMLESHIMATRFAHEDAARLAGEVFGEILKREADPGGYAYVLDCLESGS